jgi:outer membrane protein OmpA-like peptidoglycan-associated protein
MRTYLFILLSFLSIIQVHSQEFEYSTSSKKAISLYESAMHCMDLADYNCVIERLQKALEVDRTFLEAYLLMADAYDLLGNKEKVIRTCLLAQSINSEKYPLVYYFLAMAYFETGQYADALSNIKGYLSFKKYTAKQEKHLKHIITQCEFAIEALKHPVPFTPVNVGEGINSKYNEYWPSLSLDEQTLVFTRQIPKDEQNPISEFNRQEDFYASLFNDSIWQGSKNLGSPLNTPGNEGAQSLSSDGQRLYFTACDRNDGFGKCDIYYTYKKDNSWIKPVNVGTPVNSYYSEKQPSISADGRTLYFTSNRPSGKGGYDIYMSTLTDEGKWTPPVNLGDSVNTSYDEQSPFIHSDNKTLYFASNGWPGMGNLDIYFSKQKGENIWSTPVNLGYPINTYAEEMGLIVNAKGNHAYYSSERIAGKGKDIFEFELYEKARPLPVSYMKGKVYDSISRVPLAAKFELIELQTSEVISESQSSQFNGEFLVCIPTDKDYVLNVSKKGYLFYSDNFTLTGENDKTKPFLKDVPLQPIQEGSMIVLKNIFFNTNSYELKKESTTELNKVVQFLTDNTGVKVEISGHTDNVGTDAFNLSLSQNRAKSVADYLISKGIESSRMNYKGYGKTLPISNNSTEKGRSLNRRTEFKIISGLKN